MRGFFEARGSPEVRASKRAKASGVSVVGGGRPVSLARRERRRRMRGIERRILPIVERRLPNVSMRDMIAKKEECVAVKVDSIIPAKERQLSTIERTSAKAATRTGLVAELGCVCVGIWGGGYVVSLLQ
jgi:hypothetical protein